jgi:hypothetical protein
MLTGVWPANVIEGPHWWKSLFRFRESGEFLIFWAPATFGGTGSFAAISACGGVFPRQPLAQGWFRRKATDRWI